MSYTLIFKWTVVLRKTSFKIIHMSKMKERMTCQCNPMLQTVALINDSHYFIYYIVFFSQKYMVINYCRKYSESIGFCRKSQLRNEWVFFFFF